jgi:transcriptional regulator with XRE-family HTH domain
MLYNTSVPLVKRKIFRRAVRRGRPRRRGGESRAERRQMTAAQRQAIGARIRAARESREMQQARLAELLGVTRGCVSCWERGGGLPLLGTFMRLCEILRRSSDWLLFGTARRGVLWRKNAARREGGRNGASDSGSPSAPRDESCSAGCSSGAAGASPRPAAPEDHQERFDDE